MTEEASSEELMIQNGKSVINEESSKVRHPKPVLFILLFFRNDDSGITEADKAVLSLRTQRRKLNAERKRVSLAPFATPGINPVY